MENHHFWHVLVSNGLNDLYDAIKMGFFFKSATFFYIWPNAAVEFVDLSFLWPLHARFSREEL